MGADGPRATITKPAMVTASESTSPGQLRGAAVEAPLAEVGGAEGQDAEDDQPAPGAGQGDRQPGPAAGDAAVEANRRLRGNVGHGFPPGRDSGGGVVPRPRIGSVGVRARRYRPGGGGGGAIPPTPVLPVAVSPSWLMR